MRSLHSSSRLRFLYSACWNSGMREMISRLSSVVSRKMEHSSSEPSLSERAESKPEGSYF